MNDPPSTSLSLPTPSAASTELTPLPLSAATLLLSLDDPTHNPVEEAGPNHFERPAPTLTPLEQFYVDVAHSFAQQQVTRRTTNTPHAASQSASTAEEEVRREEEEWTAVHQYLGRTRTTLQHFASMLDKLLARKTLHFAFTQPDSQHSQPNDDRPTDAAFLLSRRNRLAALIQSHSKTLSTAAQTLSRQSTTLSQSLALTHRYARDLSHLSLHWLVRVRPAVVSTVVPPVVVDVSWMSGQEAAGRVRLDRDSKGRVQVGEEVGRRSESEEEQWRRTRRRRERRRQHNMTAEQQQNEEEMQWETDDTTLPTTPSHPSHPPPPPTSLLGWPRTAARLHRHQRHLLQLQLYNALMAEAQGWQSTQLSSVSVLSHTVHCYSPAFPSLSVAFNDGPQYPFTLRIGGSTESAVDGHCLYLSLLSQLTRHFIRYASSNRPLPGTVGADEPLPPPPPPLLHHLITTVYYHHLTTAVHTTLHAATPAASAVTVDYDSNTAVNVMRFVLKRSGALLLDGVVDGVSMHAVVRRGKRLGVVGGGGGSDVSVLDVELVRCVSVQQMVELIHFALQPT